MNEKKCSSVKLFLVIFIIYVLTSKGAPRLDKPEFIYGDPVTMFMVTENLINKKTIFLNRAGSGILFVNERYVSKYGIAQSLVNIPFYLMGKILIERLKISHDLKTYLVFSITTLTNIFLTALTGLLLMKIYKKFFDYKVSLFLVITYCFATFSWFYSRVLFSEPLQTFLLMLIFYLLINFDRDRKFILLSGIALGILINTKIIFIMILPVILFYISFINFKKRNNKLRLILSDNFTFLCSFSIFIPCLLWYNFIRFGSLFEFGYNYDLDRIFGFSTPFWVGLYGLLFSSGKGLFLYSPILILSLISFKRFIEIYPIESILILGISVMIISIYSSWWCWSGGWCWGPRFLLPILPLLIIPLGIFLKAGSTNKIIFIIFLCFSIFIQILSISINSDDYTRLMRRSIGYFPRYNPSMNLLRDDQLDEHFIPELSPLIGHFWLFKCLFSKSFLNERVYYKVLMDFPLRTLFQTSKPIGIESALYLDFALIQMPLLWKNYKK